MHHIIFCSSRLISEHCVLWLFLDSSFFYDSHKTITSDSFCVCYIPSKRLFWSILRLRGKTSTDFCQTHEYWVVQNTKIFNERHSCLTLLEIKLWWMDLKRKREELYFAKLIKWLLVSTLQFRSRKLTTFDGLLWWLIAKIPVLNFLAIQKFLSNDQSLEEDGQVQKWIFENVSS